MAGFSLLEMLFVLGLSATVGAVAIPQALVSLDDMRAGGAARYIAARLQRARTEAVTRNVSTALRISRRGASFEVAVYVDGNGNGVLSRDIQTGVDTPIAAPERLAQQFDDVGFGAIDGVPAVDASSTPPGADPIRLGSSDMAVFSPIGTSTTGSLYVLGQRKAQYVVRLYGETGKTRVLKFDRRSRLWVPISGA